MPPRSILITYTLHPPPPLSSSSTSSSSSSSGNAINPLQAAIKGIQSQLPLRNLHWKSSTRTALRTIQEVDVRLAGLGEVPSGIKEVGGSLLEGALVNLCLVVCEDAENYKTQTRSFIRDWLSLLSSKRNVQTPLIILINPTSSTSSTSSTSTKNIFGQDKGILGKLKTDFNTSTMSTSSNTNISSSGTGTKRDRCVQVNLPSGASSSTDDPAVWIEVMNKIKERIVLAFDAAVLEREEEVKRGEAQRMMVGWNFCTWFLLKESLAHSFSGVNLHEDALTVYEELEATFFQVLKEQNLSWFGKLGATGPRDDSLPILDTNAKPFREMLQTSTISIFDFRVYVFACQAMLLGRLGRITEIAKRGQWFLASLTRRLRESEADLAEHFIESWTYTACMDIVTKCDQWSRVDRPNGDYSGLIAYESARSELLDMARVQVERIGVSTEHLPDTYPFSPTSAVIQPSDDILFESSDHGDDPVDPDGNLDHPERSRPRLSNQQLLDAMSDQVKFKGLYLNLTKKAIMAYEACGKVNSVIRLKADLVGLALYTEEWNVAYELGRDLARSCADLRTWSRVEKYALEAALRSHRILELAKGEEWVKLALAYLRVCSTSEDNREMKEDVSALRSVAVPYSVIGHPACEVRVVGDVTFGEEVDVCEILVVVVNQLPVTMSFDEMKLEYISNDGDPIYFTSGEFSATSGTSKIMSRCTTSVQGVFRLRSARLLTGHVKFEYPSEDSGSVVYMRRNPHGLKAISRMPYDIALDSETSLVVEIHPGSCQLNDVRLALQSMGEALQYLLRDAHSGDCVVNFHDNYLSLEDLKLEQVTCVTIPYNSVSHDDLAQARIVMTYTSSDGSMRTYIDMQSLSMGLPLTVNVQDFFRPDCLISHFTIASDGREYLRIASVQLKSPEDSGYEVEACREAWDTTATITPLQPLSTVFKIRSTSQSTGTGPAPAVLRLAIKYRSIEAEVHSILDDLSAPALIRKVTRKFLGDRAGWLAGYLATGDLAGCFDAFCQKEGCQLVEGMEGFLQRLERAVEPSTPWRTLEIPVDVPQRRLITSVRLNHHSDGLIYEGRAFPIHVQLKTSFSWANAPVEEVQLVFDVQANMDDWLVLGRKKGFYTANPEKVGEKDIVLVPMRAGRLFLPTVSVQYLPDDQVGDGGEKLLCETHVENAAEVINVLPAKGMTTILIPMTEAGMLTEDGRRG